MPLCAVGAQATHVRRHEPYPPLSGNTSGPFPSPIRSGMTPRAVTQEYHANVPGAFFLAFPVYHLLHKPERHNNIF